MKNEDTTWLTDVSQVPNVNDASLMRALLSIDGCGKKIKTEALNELLKRRTESMGHAIIFEQHEKERTRKEAQEIINSRDKEIADLQETIKDLKSQLESAEERIDRMEDREE